MLQPQLKEYSIPGLKIETKKILPIKPTIKTIKISYTPKVAEKVIDLAAGEMEVARILLRKPLDGLGLTGAFIGEPIVLIVPKFRETTLSHDYFVSELCKEIYRELHGGLPKPYVFDKMKGKGLLEYFVDIGEKFTSKIAIFDDLEAVKDYPHIFRELFSQGLGFLIFIVSQEKSNKIGEEIESLKEKIRQYSKPYKPKVITVPTYPLDESVIRSFGIIKELTCKIFGLTPQEILKKEIMDRESLEQASVDDIYSTILRLYKDFIYSCLSFGRYMLRVLKADNECEEHLALKALTVKHLVEQENIPLEDVYTEYPVAPNVIADVYVKGKGIVVEVETLYGVGPQPILKIRDTVMKYRNVSGIREIRIVLRSIPVMLYTSSLWSLRRTLREEMSKQGVNVEFYIPNISSYTLEPLPKVLKECYTIIKKKYPTPKQKEVNITPQQS